MIDRSRVEHAAKYEANFALPARELLSLLNERDLWVAVHPCRIEHEGPYDFDQCTTHDRTFPRGGSCDHAGLSEVGWMDHLETQQRVRAISAEDRVEQAEAQIEAAREVHTPIDAVHEQTGQHRQVCAGCGTDAGNWQLWPCPTIRAIGRSVTRSKK